MWLMQSKNGILNWNKLMSGSLDCMVREEGGGGNNSTLSPSEARTVREQALAINKKKKEERDAVRTN